MENPYAAPQGHINTPYGETAPLTWKEILFSFQGRVPRRTYWGVSIVMNVVYYAIAFVLTSLLGEDAGAIASLVLLIPMIWVGLAVTVKRWHDRDKSGWWIFIVLIPIVGAIWAFVENGFLRGTVGPNQYGGDPT